MCKRNKRIRVCRLTKREYELILDNANFTDEQLNLFVQLNKDQYFDFAIMDSMKLTANRYYEIKGIVVDKVERIARDYGFYESIVER